MPTARRPRLTQPLQPLFDSIRRYDRRCLRGDLLAGITVAVLEIPQAMAYAYIAGVPPQYGIYTSIIQGLVGALLSSNDHLASGPTNTHALLVAATVTRLVDPGDASTYLQLCFALCVIKGLIQVGFATARMGDLIRYVSNSVIVGFTAGAGVLIAVGQLPAFLGIVPAEHGPLLPGVLGSLQQIGGHVGEVNGLAVLVGAGCLAIMIGLRAVNPLLPGPLLAVVLAGVAVALLGWTPADLPLVGDVPGSGLPHFTPPSISLHQVEQLLPGAFALALLGMIETVAIGKSIMTRHGRRVSPNQEFLAQGVANIVGGFFQNFPGTGSFTRSALNDAAGGKTRFAGVFNSVFVLVIFVAFREQARFIPTASLAAVLMVIAYGLIDWRYIRKIMRTDRADVIVCLTSFAATLVLPLHYAIYVGVFLNLGLYLRRASQLHMAEMVRTKAGGYAERELKTRDGTSGDVIFIQIEGDLFFAVADELADNLALLERSGHKVVIFRLKRTHSIDATVLAVLETFVRAMQARGKHVLLCGVREELIEKLRAYGLVDLIGRNNVFAAGYGVFTSAKAALRRAREILGSSIDEEDLDTSEDPGVKKKNGEWTYDI